MIVSILKGGLGNMMFQIAAGLSLAIDLNVEFAYTLDGWTGVTKHNISHFPNTIFENIKHVNKEDILDKNFSVFKEKDFTYSALPLKDNLLLDGYFQSEKYFAHNREKIRQAFNVEPVQSYEDYTFLHVRRKDYLLYANVHGICPMSYYQNALNHIVSSKCIVLSDDIEWCKRNMDISNVIYSSSKTELEDMSIMISCKNSIIANSTFSWWGAWLSNSEKVVAPKNWFGPQGPKHWQDIYCKDWIIL
jgi:hypothetical protein